MPSTDDRRISAAFFLAALICYVPGIWWGLLEAGTAEQMYPWGSDELAPLGPLAQVGAVLLGYEGATFSPQYPLFHYLVEAIFQAPYLGWLWLTGGLTDPGTSFPYGLTDPRSSLATLTLLGRLPSLLMAAGTVTLAWKTATEWWDRRTGLLAGASVLLMYPMFYYARTSNVDMAGLFWTAAGIYLYQRVLRKGLTLPRASYLAFFAAAAMASKDALYSVFAVMALVVVMRHLRAAGGEGGEDCGSRWDRSKLIAVGVGVFAVTYSLISGLAFAPERFLTHVDFVLHGTGDHPEGIVSTYYGRPLSIGGILAVTVETVGALREALGLPFLLLSGAGIGHALLRDREKLLLLLPLLGIFFGVILPVRFIRLRFVVPLALGFAFFAARGAVVLTGVGLRRLRWAVLPAVALCFLWSALRGADLTRQMIHDSRYEVSHWLRQHTRPGDRVGYYGAPVKLPRLEPGVEAVRMPGQIAYDGEPPPDSVRPEFVLVIPVQRYEGAHEWTLPDSTFRALIRGTMGYELVLAVRGPALLEAGTISFVNPPCRVFVREDIVPRISLDHRRLELPPPPMSTARSGD